ncbi:MAG TPA: class I SAM-dependent methyltransferase [Allosphingosinicella sp.]|jgi:SAM-dependent methyltransferase
MGLQTSGRTRRAERALQRQLDYQRRKSAQVKGHEQQLIASMMAHSNAVRGKLEAVKPIAPDARVLEVGCGAHGLIFYFGTENGVGVDPLADHYAELFPAWQSRARTIAAPGEHLPFKDASFDVVLCDNVVDHAEGPRQIVEELARVLAPGGLLYFEVNVHHPFYHVAATTHAAWRALGIPFEITPFADHTVHFTLDAARRLFDGLPFRIVSESDNIAEVKDQYDRSRTRHAGDRLKRFFFKNAQYRVIAVREG